MELKTFSAMSWNLKTLEKMRIFCPGNACLICRLMSIAGRREFGAIYVKHIFHLIGTQESDSLLSCVFGTSLGFQTTQGSWRERVW
jgi:hypothetical protein